MEEGKPGGGGGATVAEDAMSRFSLDASAGGRHSTLLDEYERLAFEAQLNRAIVLRRCYSEPSPVRVAHQQQKPAGDANAPTPAAPREAPPPDQEGEARRRDGGGGRFWRLHEVLARWLEALRPVFRWLRSAWERRRRKDEPADAHAARRPPPTVPRVQLLDYLR
ncbi:hypothetical protein SEVIR_3G209400v4 [Setaria viridis]|uniref:Uncharacterized protein n=2 Tax=Setaria TaxID=4554 RepID=K3ZC43_SETIT|nr:uncharacterized protein LOC105914082 [Setaria italica]XP_034588635.1 uncharacterized protein LOC117850865 [Setaria viridis]XP_034588636.1 uncharacterized protein LOC117850865 [Setaria viridis]RCV17243.1 hypothetical protein SETIT_3G204400v2 [Setaria italica]TKW26730.1 hypothetical protein SEVIR_3G209400v2 [Setaria viridis]